MYTGSVHFFYTRKISIFSYIYLHIYLQVYDYPQRMIQHLKEEHKVNIDVKEVEFLTYEEFMTWKSAEEENINTSYVQHCGARTSTTAKVWYFYCNRAGKYKSKSSGKRQNKSQGTSKIGDQCSAHLKAVQHLNSGKVSVTYCNTHHNHAIKLAHLRMPQHYKMELAAKLLQGVTMDRILDDIRDGITNRIVRSHLVNRQDLHNLKRQYNIDGIIRHKNDLTSVTAWVEETRTLPFNPILRFKQQGFKQSDDIDNVADNDFLLCIQTEFQRDMCKKLGGNVVCIDSTHGTNNYDFKLVTILVVDE